MLYTVKTQIIWVATAFFLAVALNPIVQLLASRAPKQRRGLATGLVYLMLILFLAGIGYMLFPPLVRQTQVLLRDIPSYVEQLREGDSWLSDLINRYDLVNRLKDQQEVILTRLTQGTSSVVRFAQGVFSGVIATLTILTLTYFMLVEGPRWRQRLLRLLPKAKRNHYSKLGAQMYKVVTGYVTGNLLISLIAAISATVMLMIVGIPFAIPLGILVGILDLLPLVGATLAAVIVVTVCLFTSVSTALIMAVFFLIYQQLENNLLQPLVYGRTVQLSPLMVLVAAIFGVSLGGVVGAVAAIPVAACLQIIARDLLSHYLDR